MRFTASDILQSSSRDPVMISDPLVSSASYPLLVQCLHLVLSALAFLSCLGPHSREVSQWTVVGGQVFEPTAAESFLEGGGGYIRVIFMIFCC